MKEGRIDRLRGARLVCEFDDAVNGFGDIRWSY